jgi:hypothetical protein
MDFSKYLGEVGLTELWNLMLAHIDGRLFVGTRAEYEAAASSIPEGALVVITDDGDVVLPSADATTATIGIAQLGKMILGN